MRSIGTRAVGVWAFTVGGAAAALVSAFVTVAPSQTTYVRQGVAARQAVVAKYSADSLAHVVTTHDLFRADRRAASVPYDPVRGASPLPDGPPKPQLSVTGIVWGNEPEAVVEGLPTTTGPRVVRAGDRVGGVTIKRIEQSRLVAVGFDTTWTLTLRVPWK